MERAKTPCKYCADRAVGCHGTCKQYIEWAEKHKEELRIASEEKRKRMTYPFGPDGRMSAHMRTRNW